MQTRLTGGHPRPSNPSKSAFRNHNYVYRDSSRPLKHFRYPGQVTVCIAGLADMDEAIVTACDSMLSSPEFSGDNVAHKLFPLSNKFIWAAMVAGDDITHVAPLMETAVIEFFALNENTNTMNDVERLLASTYQKVRLRYAEDLVLGPIGLTLEAFHKKPEWQGYLVEKLEAVDLGCQLLVVGFDFAGHGHIFTVENPGIVRNHDLSGWAAIGSGAYSAIGTLLHHSVNHSMELARVLYHVCEAKFMAESAAGVGKHTDAMVLTPQTLIADRSELSEEFIAMIREDWEKHGRPRLPTIDSQEYAGTD